MTALEVKRDTMLAEEKTLISPQEEREKLFQQVGFTGVKGNKHHHSHIITSLIQKERKHLIKGIIHPEWKFTHCQIYDMEH